MAFTPPHDPETPCSTTGCRQCLNARARNSWPVPNWRLCIVFGAGDGQLCLPNDPSWYAGLDRACAEHLGSVSARRFPRPCFFFFILLGHGVWGLILALAVWSVALGAYTLGRNCS